MCYHFLTIDTFSWYFFNQKCKDKHRNLRHILVDVLYWEKHHSSQIVQSRIHIFSYIQVDISIFYHLVHLKIPYKLQDPKSPFFWDTLYIHIFFYEKRRVRGSGSALLRFPEFESKKFLKLIKFQYLVPLSFYSSSLKFS